tara:strand:- start:2622 stop:2837 length:216 start_codon:yes stop_codon:yes gene_type:complete
MLWRLTSAEGFKRYQARCFACGELRGWTRERAAQGALEDLRRAGLVGDGDRFEQYMPGDDDTCVCDLTAPD